MGIFSRPFLAFRVGKLHVDDDAPNSLGTYTTYTRGNGGEIRKKVPYRWRQTFKRELSVGRN